MRVLACSWPYACARRLVFILIVIPYKLLFQIKVAVEILFLIHLITAFPILINPPCQLFENILNIPLSKCYLKIYDTLQLLDGSELSSAAL